MEASIINIHDIISWEEIPMEPVYDIEVDNNHNFYIATETNPILVHNSGKSDWVDEMCLGYNAQYDWKTAICSVENKPNFIHAAKLEAKICGQWVSRQDQINSTWHKSAKEFIDFNFKFIDLEKYDLEEVLIKTKSLIKKFGIKVLVLDPYNKIRLRSSLTKNINEYTNDYLNKIDEFARNNDILIILVAHPVKPSGIERLNYEPDFYSIKGGGEFYDMSPHGLLVHRDYSSDLVKIKVLKVKFSQLGKNHEHVWYKWNKKNGRYSELLIQDEEALKCSNIEDDNTNWLTNEINNNQIDFVNVNKNIEPNFNFDDSFQSDGKEIPF